MHGNGIRPSGCFQRICGKQRTIPVLKTVSDGFVTWNVFDLLSISPDTILLPSARIISPLSTNVFRIQVTFVGALSASSITRICPIFTALTFRTTERSTFLFHYLILPSSSLMLGNAFCNKDDLFFLNKSESKDIIVVKYFISNKYIFFKLSIKKASWKIYIKVSIKTLSSICSPEIHHRLMFRVSQMFYIFLINTLIQQVCIIYVFTNTFDL